MSSLEKLTKHFERFPGIGPRQARRFVYHLLNENPEEIQQLSEGIASIKATVANCPKCFRYFVTNGSKYCEICTDTERDASLLMVVEQDSDIVPIERSGVYKGYYFVLGGTVPLLDSEDTKKLRGSALKKRVEKLITDGEIKEVILAFSVNPDGENTARYVESLLNKLDLGDSISVTVLGRGLSTGSELEYADPETIKNALRNRG